MKKVKILSLVFCLAILFTACKQNTEKAISDNQISDTQKEISETELSETPPQPNENEIVKAPLPDLMPSITECGKTVTVYGELCDSEYSADVAELQAVLDGYNHNISVCVYALDNSKALCYNTSAEIFGACTVKAPYTLYCYKQLEQGVGSLDTTIIYEQKHYEPGTGDMQYSSFGTEFTLRTALSKCMSISDNVGYLMAVDYFGRDGYNQWISSLGCDSLKIRPTVWSLKTKSIDLVKAWREIYNYFETDSQYARFLYDSCTNTADNYATAALSGVEYSHKQGHNSTGDWLSYSDAGIVYKEGSPYIIAVLTDAPGSSANERQIMSQIINIVHNKMF